METRYYHTESNGNFFDLKDCLLDACREANRCKEAVKIYRLLEYRNGDSEHVHLLTALPGEGA